MKHVKLNALFFCAMLVLSACGGGSGGSDPTSANRLNETILGTITGFGSMYVDGVKYEIDDDTEIIINGEPAEEDELKHGMVVLVEASEDDDGSQANRIEFSHEIEGLVDVNRVSSDGVLIVMGQTLHISPITYFETKVENITSMEAIPMGAIVEVSGYRESDGKIHVTRIEVKQANHTLGEKLEVKGLISELDEDNHLFLIGALWVDYSKAVIGGDLSLENYVEVESTLGKNDNGQLIASQVKMKEQLDEIIDIQEDKEIKLEGLITDLEPSVQFTLNSFRVFINQDTEIDDGPLQENLRIKLAGYFNSDGAIVAKEIEVIEQEWDEISGIVTAVDQEDNTVTINGQTVYLSDETMVEDSWEYDRLFHINDIEVGDLLEIDVKELDGILFAVKLDREDGSHEDENEEDEGGVPVVEGNHKVLAFNDLGMHCADLDYSTFVILPPYNVVHSQVIERGAEPRILSNTEVNVAYKAQMDATGSINTTSQNQPAGIQKSNFWEINPDTGNRYVFDLFGLDSQPDEGLAFGQKMPGINAPYTNNDAQAFNHYDEDKGWFAADGIPILPIDDYGQAQAYPLVQVEATDIASGESLASLDVVLPVASEADCQNCHALGEVGANRDGVEFIFPDDINDPNAVLQAAKVNILRLHDEKHGTDLDNQRPVLCASCHYSAALDLTGTGPSGDQIGRAMMSQVMHGHHGQLTDPATGDDLFPENGSLEETCYQCHPGKTTKCLRGAMGGAGITCQDCHGGMLAVGGVYNLPAGTDLAGTNDGTTPRQPWIDEPRCESCHTGDALGHLGDSIRLTKTWEDNDPSAAPRIADNKRFAENEGELYRNSLGHGGVACEGCHGSTHAIWPNALPSSNDNIAAVQLQGHAGTISECSTCHTSLPLTLDGPHGMHNVNSPAWTEGHEEFYKQNPDACKACHGLNLEGTALSRMATDRELESKDNGSIHLAAGTEVSCTLCHERPEQRE